MSTPAVPPEVPDAAATASRREGWPARARRLLVGDDVFISYSRADASDYALALADELTKAGLSCFLDQWGTRPQGTLPADLTAALRASSALVVIASPGAVRSRFVGEEVAIFRRLHRPILPVSIDDAVLEAPWRDEVEGLACNRDTAEELTAGRPGRDVVARITAALAFRSRRRRLRMALYATAVLLVGAAVLLTFTVNAARRQERRARALGMANDAAELVASDPAGALRMALVAMDEDDNLPAGRVLADVLRRYDRLTAAIRADTRGGVRGVAFSPDGALLVTTGEDVRLRFWDVRTLRELPAPRPTETHDMTGALGFTPDGRWLIWGGAGHVAVWRVADRTPVSVLDVPGWVDKLAIRRDGLVAVSGGHPLVRLLRLDANGRLRETGSVPLPPDEYVNALSFHPVEGTLAVGGRRNVYLADADQGVVRREIRLDPGFNWVEKVAFAPDGRSLAISDVNNRVLRWSTETWTRSELLPRDAARTAQGERTALAFHPEGTLLAAGRAGLILASGPVSPDREGRAPLDTVGVWSASLSALAVSSDGRTLASASWDGTVALWRLDGTRWLQRDVHSGVRGPFAIATDGGGRRFLTSLQDSMVGVWDAQTGASVPLRPRARAGVLNPGGTRATVAWRDSLAVYTLGAGRAAAGPPIATGIANPIEMHVSGNGQVVVVCGDSAAFAWDVEAGRSAGRVAGVNGVLAVSPDGRRLAFAEVNGGLTLTDVDGQGRTRLSSDADGGASPLAAVFTRGGRELLSYHGNGVLVRWRLEGLRRGAVVIDTIADRSAAAAGVRSWAEFSADGSILAVKLGSRPTLVWDIARGGPLLWAGASDPQGRMALSRDGSRLVVADASAAPYSVDLSPRVWVLAACSILAAPTGPTTTTDRVDRICRDAKVRAPQR